MIKFFKIEYVLKDGRHDQEIIKAESVSEANHIINSVIPNLIDCIKDTYEIHPPYRSIEVKVLNGQKNTALKALREFNKDFTSSSTHLELKRGYDYFLIEEGSNEDWELYHLDDVKDYLSNHSVEDFEVYFLEPECPSIRYYNYLTPLNSYSFEQTDFKTMKTRTVNVSAKSYCDALHLYESSNNFSVR